MKLILICIEKQPQYCILFSTL